MDYDKLIDLHFGTLMNYKAASIEYYLKTGTVSGTFRSELKAMLKEACEGKDDGTSEKDLRVCNVSVSLLIRMKEFIDNAIFNHNADAAPMHINDYKKSVKLSKQLARQLIKCNGR